MSFSGAKRIGTLISPLTLRELGMPADVARLPEITTAWVAAVGKELSGHVRPIRYTGGRLVLRAGSAVWVSKVRHSHEMLVQRLRLQPLFKDLTGLEVRAAPLSMAQRQLEQRVVRNLSPRTRKLLEDVAGDITDPALRAALSRLGRKPPDR